MPALSIAETGSGPAVLALHGAYSTREEVLGFLPPMLPEHRVIAPDLPGAGQSMDVQAATAADILPILEATLDAATGGEKVLVVGHSFGAHIARGLVARNPARHSGLVLICPLVPDDVQPEAAHVEVDDGASASLSDEERAAFEEYFVVRTAATVEAFRSRVVPTIGRYDAEAVTSQMGSSALELPATDIPTLILAARRDAYVGWRQVPGLLDAYPNASAYVAADAGHALPHEQPEVVGGLIRAWVATGPKDVHRSG